MVRDNRIHYFRLETWHSLKLLPQNLRVQTLLVSGLAETILSFSTSNSWLHSCHLLPALTTQEGRLRYSWMCKDASTVTRNICSLPAGKFIAELWQLHRQTGVCGVRNKLMYRGICSTTANIQLSKPTTVRHGFPLCYIAWGSKTL